MQLRVHRNSLANVTKCTQRHHVILQLVQLSVQRHSQLIQLSVHRDSLGNVAKCTQSLSSQFSSLYTDTLQIMQLSVHRNTLANVTKSTQRHPAIIQLVQLSTETLLANLAKCTQRLSSQCSSEYTETLYVMQLSVHKDSLASVAQYTQRLSS